MGDGMAAQLLPLVPSGVGRLNARAKRLLGPLIVGVMPNAGVVPLAPPASNAPVNGDMRGLRRSIGERPSRLASVRGDCCR